MKAALQTPEAEQWQEAYEAELEAIEKHGVWKEVPLSEPKSANRILLNTGRCCAQNKKKP
jgi:hypothetical protein